MSATSALHISGVTKTYGSNDGGVQALSGIDLTIAPGEFFGLLGPNGAGKTTLISIIAGLARATAGSVAIMGHDVVSAYRQSRRALGVVPQELVFDPFFTVRETLRMQSGYFGIPNNDKWIDEILANLDLTAKADTNMRSLSGGMKRRVLVGQALVHRPPVILLDEPTAGVDVELRQTLWQFIRRLNADGHTIVLTTHYLEEAESLCNRIAMLKGGKVIALDTTANLLKQHSSISLKLKLSGAALPDALATRAKFGKGDGVARFGIDHLSEVEPLLAALRTAGVTVDEMALEQPDLEEVFLQLTSSKKIDGKVPA